MMEFHVPPEEYKKTALKQRKAIRDIAHKLEEGKEITELEREIARGILEAWADKIPLEDPKLKHADKIKLDPGSLAIEYVILRTKGAKKTMAQERLADVHGVSRQAIKKSLEKNNCENLKNALQTLTIMGVNEKHLEPILKEINIT